MTTAARPTFDPAKGGKNDLSALSKQYSSRDLPGHTKLKYREPGQGTNEEVRSRDFRRDLEERERVASRDKERGRGAERDRRAIEPAPAAKRSRQEAIQASIDADDRDSDSDSSDSDEDDTAELMAELARIKAERAAEAIRKEEQQRRHEEQIRTENLLQGNPLLQYASTATKADFRVKRRWDDDVVFKNCSRSEPEKKDKIFINDSLRSEFHRRFMEKYIK
nr:EOG090X0IT3 [Artemia franciscana]